MNFSTSSLLFALASSASAFAPQSHFGIHGGANRPLFFSDLAQEWASRNGDETRRPQQPKPAASKVASPSPAGPPSPASNGAAPAVAPAPINNLAMQWANRNKAAESVPQPVMARSAAAESKPQSVKATVISNPPSVAALTPVEPPPVAESQLIRVKSETVVPPGNGPTDARLDQINSVLGNINRQLEKQSAAPPTSPVTDAKLDDIAQVLGNLNKIVVDGQSKTESAVLGDLDQRVNDISQQLAGITHLISQQNAAINSHTRSIEDQTSAIGEQTRHQRILSAMGQTHRGDFEFHYQCEGGTRGYDGSAALCDSILAHFLNGEGYCLPHEAVLKNSDNRRFLPNSKENWMQRYEEDYDSALAEANLEFRENILGQLTAIMGMTPVQSEENGWYCLYFDITPQ